MFGLGSRGGVVGNAAAYLVFGGNFYILVYTTRKGGCSRAGKVIKSPVNDDDDERAQISSRLSVAKNG